MIPHKMQGQQENQQENQITWLWGFQRNMDIVKRLGFGPGFAELAGKCVYISRKGNIDFYWDQNEVDKQSLELIKKAKTSDKFLNVWTEDCKQKAELWKNFTENLPQKNLSQLSKEKLLDLYEGFLFLHQKLGYYACFIRVIVNKGVEEFERILSKKINNKTGINNKTNINKNKDIKPKINLQKALNILTSTIKESFCGEEEKEFLTLAFEILKNDSDLNDLSEESLITLKNHQEKYCWIPCGYYDEPSHTLEYYLHRLNRIQKNPETAREALKKIQNLSEQIGQQQQVILTEIKLTNEEIRLMETLQECVYYKDFVRGFLNKGYYLSYPFFEELGRRCNLSMLEVKFLFEYELKELLRVASDKPHNSYNQGNNYTELKTLITKRMNFHVMIFEKNKEPLIIYGQDAQTIAGNIEGRDKSEVIEIKGQCANPGYAKARVRILKNPADIQNETHDFILVASMTTPEFVIAMQKALAIVTDEGGITCHAAIVARELNKPCVIGTKNASKLLKHGNIIEVIADEGLIRIIK